MYVSSEEERDAQDDTTTNQTEQIKTISAVWEISIWCLSEHQVLTKFGPYKNTNAFLYICTLERGHETTTIHQISSEYNAINIYKT